MRFRSLSSRRAFTLVELLVVVAIMALLLSILLPSLNRAREQARSVACMSNLKQLHTGNVFYADDSDDYYVPNVNDVSDGWEGWQFQSKFKDMLQLRDTNTWDGLWPDGLYCPTQLDRRKGAPWHFYPYTWISVPFTNNGIQHHQPSVRLPSEHAMFVDGNDHNIGSMEGANYHKYWDRTGAVDGRNGGAWWVVTYRHLEGANIVHFDGHGDYYPKEEAWPEDEAARERLWRPYDTDVYRPGR